MVTVQIFSMQGLVEASPKWTLH